MNLFDLSAVLTLDASEYENGINNANEQSKTFGQKLSSGLKVAGVALGALTASVGLLTNSFVQNINKTAEYGDKVDKMSQKIGISAESYQKWDYVMQRAGGNVDSLKMGMKTLSQQAEKGSESFQKLGISQEEVANLSQEELFEKTVKGLSELEAGTERTALATELLGRAGADMGPLLNQGSDAIEEQMKIAEDYGMVMSDATVKASADFEDSLTTMNMTMTGLKNRMMGEFLPTVTMVTDGLAKLFTGDMSGLDDIEKGVNGVIDKLSAGLPKFMEIGGRIISGIGEAIMKNLPALVSKGTEIITQFINTIVEGLPSIASTGSEIIQSIIGAITDALPTLLENFANNIGDIVAVGVDLITGLIDGITKAIPILIQHAPKIIAGLVKGLVKNLPKILSSGIQLIGSLVKGIIKAIPKLVATAPKLIGMLVKGIIGLGGKLLSAGVKLIARMVSGIVSMGGKILSAGKDLVLKLISGIGGMARKAVDKIKELVGALKTAVVNKAKDFISAGKELVSGIWQGISNGKDWIKGKIKEWVGNIKDFLKNLFGIKSPSKWARDVIGWNIAKGLAIGIESGQNEVQDAMDELIPDAMFDQEIALRTATTQGSDKMAKLGTTYITNEIEVNGAENPEDFTSRLTKQMKLDMRAI